VTLSAADENYRIGKFTGSLANVVMNATTGAAWNKAWREKVGLDPPPVETYAMRCGSHMEPMILNERELQTGQKITRRGEIVDHPSVSDICVKLDGYRAADDSIIEVKFLAPWRNREEFVPAYYPQTILQLLCVKASKAILVVAQGTSDPVEHEILFDQDYADELMRRAALFIKCMKTLTPPCPMPPVVPPEKWRTLDLDAEPTNWSPELINHLNHYAATAEAAQLHDLAGSAARKLIPDDVGRVLVRSWTITRDRRGILSIRNRRAAA
jgi:predicted phage-related endonuclease